MAKSLWKQSKPARRTMELVSYGTLLKGVLVTIAAAIWGWLDGLAPSVIGVLSLFAGSTVVTALVLVRRKLYPLADEEIPVTDQKTEAPAVSTKVVATKKGFDGLQLRQPGDVFTIMLVPSQPMPTWLQLADKPLTPDEKLAQDTEIQALRTVWTGYFCDTVMGLHSLVTNVYYLRLDKRFYWAELATPKMDRLYTATGKMSEAVADDSSLRLGEVKARHVEVHLAYLDAWYWFAKIIDEEKIDLTESTIANALERWRKSHVKVREKLHDLVQRPALKDVSVSVFYTGTSHLRLLDSATPPDPSEPNSPQTGLGAAEEKRKATQATAKFLSDHARGFEELAVELEAYVHHSRLEEIRKRCDALFDNVKNHLTANRGRLGVNFVLDFLGVHATEAFPNPGGWPTDRYQPWLKARKSALHLRDFIQRLGVETELPSAEAIRRSVVSRLQSVEDERVKKRLASVTEEEARFLDLFCVSELPMQPEKRETWLPHSVYQSGHALVTQRILTSTENADGKHRFCLTDTTSRVWNDSGRKTPPVTLCIDIDGHAVYGSGASGSGATGSVWR